MKIRKIMAIVLSLLMICAIFPVTAVAATSGSCGTNLNWNYNSETNVLTFSGSGTTMTTYSSYSSVPWYNTSYRTSIKTIVFETTALEYISNNAFKNITGLKTVVLPDTVKKLGNYVFQGCSAIEELTFPASIEEVDVSCFNGAKIERLYIDSLQSIIGLRHTGVYNANNGIDTNPWGHAEAVYINGTLTEDLVIPSDMTDVPDLVFAGSPFVTLTIHKNVTSIGNHTFYRCAKLESVSFAQDGALVSIGTSAFRECTSLTSVDLPGSVASVGEYCFYKNTSMNHVIIREGNLESFAAYSFADSKTLLTFECWPTLKTFEDRATQNGTVTNGAKGHVYYNGVRNDSGIDGTEITQNGNYGDCSVPSVYYVWHYYQNVKINHYLSDGEGGYTLNNTENKYFVGSREISPASLAIISEGIRYSGFTVSDNLVLNAETGNYIVPDKDDTAEIDLYYDTITYDVNFYGEDGETLLEGPVSVSYGDAPVYSGVLPSKENTAQFTYTLYWRDMSDGGALYAVDALPAAYSDASYKAEFKAETNSYDVTVNAGTGVTVLTDVTEKFEYGTVTLSFTLDPAYKGLEVTVNGESVEVTESSGVYSVNIPVVADTAVSVAAIPFSSFDITLDLDGGVYNGSDEDPVITVSENGEAVTLPTDVSKEGYEFDGWELNGEKVASIDPAELTGDITVKALWIEIEEPSSEEPSSEEPSSEEPSSEEPSSEEPSSEEPSSEEPSSEEPSSEEPSSQPVTEPATEPSTTKPAAEPTTSFSGIGSPSHRISIWDWIANLIAKIFARFSLGC